MFCELAVTMLIAMSVVRSRLHCKILWRAWFTKHHSLDWMVCILLYPYLCTGHLIVNFKYKITKSVLISNDWHQAHLSERFGDGDASQIGLDLDEVISICLALCMVWIAEIEIQILFQGPNILILTLQFCCQVMNRSIDVSCWWHDIWVTHTHTYI